MYRKAKFGYIIESSYAETPTYAANATFYRFGERADSLPQIFPDPKAVHSMHVPNNSLEVNYHADKMIVETAEFQFILVNGTPLYLALGKSTNTDETTYYKHVITPRDKGDELPSILLHREMEQSGGTNYSSHATGCKVSRFSIIGRENFPLIGAIVLKGSKVAAGTNLDSDPVLHPNSGTAGYKKIKTTIKFDSAELPILKSFRLNVDSGCEPIHTDRATDSQWAEHMQEADKITYNISLVLAASEHSVHDVLLSQDQTKDVEITILRSTNDKIVIDATNCAVDEAAYKTKTFHGEILHGILLRPENISIEVRDAINHASAYGGAV